MLKFESFNFELYHYYQDLPPLSTQLLHPASIASAAEPPVFSIFPMTLSLAGKNPTLPPATELSSPLVQAEKQLMVAELRYFRSSPCILCIVPQPGVSVRADKTILCGEL